MPVVHFTYHAYRDWRPNHPRGYARKGKGYQPPDLKMASNYDEAAKQFPVCFTDPVQREILRIAHDICDEEGWRLEAAGFDDGHVHLVVGWRRAMQWTEVDRRLKNLLVLKLNRARGIAGVRWFGRRRGAPRHVRTREHFNHLVTVYLPNHPGVYWKRGLPLQ